MRKLLLISAASVALVVARRFRAGLGRTWWRFARWAYADDLAYAGAEREHRCDG